MVNWSGILLLVLFSLSSCVPVTLPAFVAPAGGPPHASVNYHLRRPLIAVLSSESNCHKMEYSFSDRLGTQFMFGILPIASVYPAEQINCQVEEIVASELLLAGFDVLIAPVEALNFINKLPGFKFAINAELHSASVTAYDLLFFRIVSVSGTLTATFYENGKDSAKSFKQEFSNKNPKQYAFLPILGFYFENSIKSAFRKIVCLAEHVSCDQNLKQGQAIASEEVKLISKATDSPVIFLEPPQVSDKVQEIIGQRLDVQRSERSRSGNIARFIQQGEEEALANNEVNAVSFLLSHSADAVAEIVNENWILETHLDDLAIDSNEQASTATIRHVLRQGRTELKVVNYEITVRGAFSYNFLREISLHSVGLLVKER